VRLVTGALLAIAVSTIVSAQRATSWPVDARGDGGFSARRLAAAPAIDGREWIRADVKLGMPATWRPAKADYTLRFGEIDEEGDIARWPLLFERPGSRPVSLTAGGTTAFAYVTPDARFIFTEPLMAIDVRRWRRFALSAALGIVPYVSVEAVSPDGRRLLASRRDCPFDCIGRPTEYFVLMLPS
jgi:hypothetical protein